MFSEDLVFTDNEIGRISSELLNKIIEMRKKRLTKKKKFACCKRLRERLLKMCDNVSIGMI